MSRQRGTAIGLGMAVLIVLGGAGGSFAAVSSLSLSATMTPGQVVTAKNKPWRVPAAVKTARGTFKATLLADQRTLKWQLSYQRVPGRVIADVHLGAKGKFGAVIGRLCDRCRSGQKGTLKLKRRYKTEFQSKLTWVTLITPKYPNGVVRGQISAR